ncbi:hypothetical protein HWV07_01235 [Natronomonas salina]|uniref:hypothetical protein n=1 Tax=Natronomonas salina TaxID=1710540 RepID=UPI0015B6DEC3|nr:hypothetical protein [Natronomonas salina]QLD87729.1 hypothetical protein HWV07_01235 [Natronomonas salina]
MSPPERTFGPIGWKGLFGDDESDDAVADGSNDDEPAVNDEGHVADPDLSSAEEAIADEPSRRSDDRETTGGTAPTGSSSSVGDQVREERSRSAREFSEGRPTAAGTDDDVSGRPADTERTAGERQETDNSNLWVNPLDDDQQGRGNATSGKAASSPTNAGTGRSGDSATTPPNEARVRTSEEGTIDESESTSERTVGPIGLQGLTGDDATDESGIRRRRETESTTSTAGTPRTTSETSGTPAISPTRTPARQRTSTDEEDGLLSRIPWSISVTAIAVGVGLLVFIDIVTMMVPLLAAIGAGIIAGFVSGYIAGGTFRGALHALAVGIIGGIAVGYLTALIGALIGLFLEPATLLGGVLGPLAPELGAFGDWGPLLVMVLVTVLVAVDATIGGAVGGTVRSVVDQAR